ncbi:phosphotransferase [Sphingomonas sp. SRS2]|uniref:phosphotransferase n=1 Tax=Sphingomonas sp. SRS2 TaxID=133190 RepID=UPI00136490F5|nr:phosphotransferase [Sphingomonas sp. SRS2]
MPFASDQEAREVIDLVTEVLNDAFAGIRRHMPNGITLAMLSGGRSGAYIFKAALLAEDDQTSGGFSAVVKIAPLGAGISEKANYDQFVRPFLPTACRPELYGFATAHDRAALCYSFLGDGDKAETLTDRLAAGDLASLDSVLSSLFETLHRCWYGAGQAQAETDLAHYYLARYFRDSGSATAAETVLFGYAARYFGARRCVQGYRIGDTVFRPICETLFAGHAARTYTSCVLHGDLNSDNIILRRGRKLAGLVDFQRTGRGHVFHDLVAIELSVRINDPSDASFDDILEIERLIALGEQCVRSHPYAAAIFSIRDTALRLFDLDAVPSTYQFAVASIGLRLMKAIDLSDAARARITASVLWSARSLTEH